MRRKRLYFTESIGNYKKGEWYDNVPDDDFVFAQEKGVAVACDDHPECGCIVTKDDLAVSLSIRGGEYCPAHRASALRKPPERKRVSLSDLR